MHISKSNSSGDVGLVLNQEEAALLWTLVFASSPRTASTTSLPHKRFAKMFYDAGQEIGIANKFDENHGDGRWILSSYANIIIPNQR